MAFGLEVNFNILLKSGFKTLCWPLGHFLLTMVDSLAFKAFDSDKSSWYLSILLESKPLNAIVVPFVQILSMLRIKCQFKVKNEEDYLIHPAESVEQSF